MTDLPADHRKTIAKLMTAAHVKGSRQGFTRAVSMILKAMSCSDVGAGGALIPPPQVGVRKKRKKRRKVRVVKSIYGAECPAYPTVGGESGPPKLKEVVVKPHKYGSTQFEFDGWVRSRFVEMGKLIPNKHLGEDGREDNPHVTVKYGLHKDVFGGDVAKAVGGFGGVNVWFDGIGVFKSPKYDVVFVRVRGDKLHRLHRAVARLPHTDTHPKYIAHATIAYVKPGMGVEYAERLTEEAAFLPTRERPVRCTTLVYSAADGRRTEIDLTTADRVMKACGFTPAEYQAYKKAVADDSLDTPEAVRRYAKDWENKPVKAFADHKKQHACGHEQRGVIDRLADALAA